MKQLTGNEVKEVSGGLGPLIVIGYAYLLIEASFAVRGAGEAFIEGYKSNDKV